MSLLQRLESDLKTAMRAGDVVARETLRMVLAALKNRRIEVGAELDGEQELAVLGKAVKTRQDSAEQYEKAGRPELAEKERAEIAVIEGYLPKQLSEEETRAVVRAKAAELGVTSKAQMGALMKAVMAEHKGTVDGKAVQRLAGEILS